ncbi:MAG: YbaN family protein [Coriobacteriia bacterium]|nr:YbaN family protein [Coriobacteriia bacterium]
MSPREIKRHALLACGWLSLGLGILGMFLPILPTAPFILLAAACFARSSASLHRWLVEHPAFGVHIKDYLDGRGLRKRTKTVALLTLWASVAASTLLWVPFVVVDVFVVVTAGVVTIYLLRLPTSDSDAATRRS